MERSRLPAEVTGLKETQEKHPSRRNADCLLVEDRQQVCWPILSADNKHKKEKRMQQLAQLKYDSETLHLGQRMRLSRSRHEETSKRLLRDWIPQQKPSPEAD